MEDTFDPRTFYANVGQRLREQRIKAGVTQTELANAVHLTRTSIANIESGRQTPTVIMLFLAAAVFGCDVDYFLIGEASEVPTGESPGEDVPE